MPTDLFWIIAIGFSLFYGLFCENIWIDSFSNRPRRIHQIWFNFVGSVIGWSCLFVLWQAKQGGFISYDHFLNDFSPNDFIFVVISVLGITGLLPYLLFSISRAVDALVKLLGKLVS